ncbi:hypothetical protein KHA94_01785 [Bacillus sp. FJAT-49705]|uniref:Acetolactate synthase n=1 Tax=Cytobacillus citreus TaxID=2833586 RepID=A0ABS5NMD4_9BACI|nr:hypothetical protein [Cytobacillus citreus]MBS4188947.1 hypothetical protein [Cytobacillus citreus]
MYKWRWQLSNELSRINNSSQVAESYGIQAERANNLNDAELIIKEAFSHSNPAILEVDITEEENVFPIIPPGGSNLEAILK